MKIRLNQQKFQLKLKLLLIRLFFQFYLLIKKASPKAAWETPSLCLRFNVSSEVRDFFQRRINQFDLRFNGREDELFLRAVDVLRRDAD